ncbi:MAG: hypothetical protein KatS3mg003_0730 [Candidatus Nitrosocaldaceae archaeon]|nr:MAG: hypothetical protein KatS3mg003_0730 [Candidatus Nitrosocaldaceae archaeon]
MRVDNKVKDIAIYTALGIDMEGYKHILGFWVVEGRESKAFWADILQDMISRGLKRVSIFITDDFPGVREMIRKLFPLSDHQLCFIHMQRNLRNKLSKKVYAKIKPDLYHIKMSSNKEEGKEHFNNICNIIEEEDKEYAKKLRAKTDNYLAFLSYPYEIRRYVYTTNAVESINAGLELMRRELGGYYPSKQSLEVNYFIQIANLNDTWSRRPIPAIRANLYEIRQIMTMKYELNELV